MACIDVFAPGRVLTIPFLMEQIWLGRKGKKLTACEVYDFLLQVDDGKPLDSFCILSPHFCRKKSNNVWTERAVLSRVRGTQSGWGWFYTQEDVQPDRLVMTVPNSQGPPGNETISFAGVDATDAKMVWHRGLDQMGLDMMRDIKKSLYEVVLSTPIPSHPNNSNSNLGSWFRVIIEPAVLDIPGIHSTLQEPFIELVVPFYSLTAHVSCPMQVRYMLIEKLNEIKTLSGHKAPIVADLQRILVRQGFDALGTITRIEDHRILVGACSRMHLSIHGNPPPTLAYFGAHNVRVKLPRDAVPSAHGGMVLGEPNTDIDSIVHNWSGGSIRNKDTDLVTNVNGIVHEARQAPAKKKEELATRVKAPYAEVCFLIDRMVDAKLLLVDEHGRCAVSPMEEREYLSKVCALRVLYTEPERFVAFPNARTAFSDQHFFRIDFTASWTSLSLVRKLLIVFVAFCSVMGFVLSLIALLIR